MSQPNRNTTYYAHSNMVSHRGVQQVSNRVRDNTPYNPNNRVNQRISSEINETAANVLNITVMSTYYTSANTDRTNRDNRNKATTNTNNSSATNDKNHTNSDNNIENNTINRHEDNTVVNAFINSEGRITGVVEENLQAAIVQGPPAQGYPPSLNEINLNNNVGWRNNFKQHSRSHINNWGNDTIISISQ